LSPQEERSYESSIKLLTQELTTIAETCRPIGLPPATEAEASLQSNDASGWTGQFSSLFSAATGQRPAAGHVTHETLSGEPE
jgi:hypothetical protein